MCQVDKKPDLHTLQILVLFQQNKYFSHCFPVQCLLIELMCLAFNLKVYKGVHSMHSVLPQLLKFWLPKAKQVTQMKFGLFLELVCVLYVAHTCEYSGSYI